MLLALAAKVYVYNDIALVWALNFIFLCVCFRQAFLKPNKTIFIMSCLYILCAICTMALNTDSIDGDIKGLGTNINTLAIPIFWFICSWQGHLKGWNEKNIEKWCWFISSIGLLSVLYAWFVNISDVKMILNGVSVYTIKAYGFFPQKNIYGAFVALTIVADLFLYQKTGNWKNLFILGLKSIAVILSFSRAALLLLFLFYISDTLLNLINKKTLKWNLLLCLGGLFTLCLFLTYPSISNFIMRAIFRIEVGDAGRISILENSLSKFGSSLWHILFGVGYFNITALDMDLDNTYFYLLFSGGIIKVGFFLIGYVFSLKKIWILRSENILLGNACLSLSVAYLSFAFFESVALFELGLLNFLFGMWLYIIPYGYYGSSAKQL